jgi:hypothetical protein
LGRAESIAVGEHRRTYHCFQSHIFDTDINFFAVVVKWFLFLFFCKCPIFAKKMLHGNNSEELENDWQPSREIADQFRVCKQFCKIKFIQIGYIAADNL